MLKGAVWPKPPTGRWRDMALVGSRDTGALRKVSKSWSASDSLRTDRIPLNLLGIVAIFVAILAPRRVVLWPALKEGVLNFV